jgi:hypothetical protein
VVLIIAIIGIASYLFFLATIDVPMYLKRWQAESSIRRLSPLAGFRDASVRWVVTHDIEEWKDEIAWMSLYFSAAVWASLALCVCYSFASHLPRYRTTFASWSSNDLINASKQPPVLAHPIISSHAGGLRLRFTPPR